MKKLLAILLSAVLTASFAGCGQEESSEKAGFDVAVSAAFDDCQTA